MKKHEKPFHGDYYQGPDRKRQHEDSGKIFLVCAAGIIVLLIVEFLLKF